MKEKKVLVTGAGGFVGSHLVEKVIELGAYVTAFVKYNSRNDWGMLELSNVRDKIKVVVGDLKDFSCVKKAVNNNDIIFHLGASISVPYSYINPRDVVDTNVLGTLNVLQAALENNVEKVVHTSTSEVYGRAEYLPVDENHPLIASSPYAASKIASDKLAESFFLSFDLPVIILRPFNTYGPRQSARSIIPNIIIQAISRDEVKLGNLYPTRDFTFVTDIVDGFIKAANSKILGEVICLGSNTEISMKDLAKKLFDIIGKEPKIIQEEKRVRPESSEVLRLRCNNEKARKLLDWEPKVKFQDGLQKTIIWMKENLHLYKKNIYHI